MAAGNLDSTFGSSGEIVINGGSLFSGGVQPVDTIVQTDGKTITIGSGFSFTAPAGYYTQLKRYNTDGTIDNTFGTGGKIDTSAGYFGAKQQSDGKLILLSRARASDVTSNFVLTRFNTNGTIDNTFGTNGSLTTDVAGYGFIDERNGKILLGAGGASITTSNIVKVNLYNSDGSLDNTFGTNGTISSATFSSLGNSGIVQTDGKVLLSVLAVGGFGAIKRYNRDGSLDNNFGYDGVLLGASASLSQQSDGRILANDGARVTRYNLDGSRDYTFGTLGKIDSYGKLVIQGDGKIVTAGSKSGIAGNQQDFFLSRYSNDGILDRTFGTDGIATVDFAKGSDVLSNLTLGTDGRIFASGQTTPPSGVASFAAASLLNDLSATTNHAPVVANKLTSKTIVRGATTFNLNIPANTFSDPDAGDTLTYTAIAKTPDVVFASTPLPFNTTTNTFSFTPGVYVGPVDIQVTATDRGGLSAISDFKLTVASSNATAGNLDPTFGIDGSYGVSVDRLGGLINTTGAIVQADGKVVVNRADGTNGIKLTRYNTDGSRDLTFKNSAIANAVNNGFSGMIQQSDGKILVRGLKGDINSLTDYNNYALSRFNSDGSVDSTFGTNGSISTNLNVQSYVGTFSESNGKIYLAAGVKQSGSVQSPLQLNRYNSDGSVDSTFGTSGAVILDNAATSSKSVAAIQQQADGKALVAVNIGGSNGADYLFRYNSNGTIDSSFGTNGRVTIITASGVRPNQILQQSDGKILVTQGTNLKRYNLDGSIDPTFATSGVISFSGSSLNNTPSYFINKVMQQSDGKLIVDIVQSTSDPNRLLRYNLDGSIDNTFSGDFVGDTVFNITQASDGKIVAVGTAPATDLTGSGYVNYSENFVATRYNTSPVAPGANRAPVVATALVSKAANPGRAFTYTVAANTFSDPDLGDTLTYTATQPGNNPLPSWLTFNPTARIFSGTPIDADVGSLSVQVIATDKSGLSVNSDFDIPVGLAIAPTPIPGSDRSVYDIQPGINSSNPNVNPGYKPLNPTSLSNLIDGTLYFTADYIGGRELWKIDTTTPNSKVLLVDVNNNGNKSSSPDNLTNIGGTLYFSASDETGGRELWKLDKTPEYSKVQLLKIDPLVSSNAANLTNINGKLFFTAQDALNGTEVWLLDTTIANSKPQLFDINIGNRTSSNPADLINVNGKLYFTADDGFRGKELWRIDPTIANSKPQLFNLNRTGNVTSDGGSNPTNLTDINGTLYFSADDLINGRELWKLDPTSSAPTVIDVIPGANSSNPVGMTDVNGTLYFQASDNNNGAELWSFDTKTPGSTPRLVQDLLPGSAGSTPIDLKNFNGTLYFSAFDATSRSQRRWTLDSTTPNSKPQVLAVGAISQGLGSANDPSITKNQIDVNGTRYFTDSTSAYGTELFTAPVSSIATSNDFNGDRKSDILWRNDYGSVALWQMDGATVTNAALTSIQSIDPSWKVAGTIDFNGDRKSDILWRNASGAVAVWQMDGSTVTSSSLTSTPILDNSWKTAGTGDFNGDGKSDILWRNDDGAVVVWQMNGSSVTLSSLTSTPILDNSWKTAGTGDFNGDGKSDILWRNDDGSIALWQMNGSTVVSSSLTSTPSLDSSWKINGTGDFNGDGKADLLWSNSKTGAMAIWQMDGSKVVDSSRTSSPIPDSSWTLSGIGDFNGDGKSDLLWRNTNNAVDIWQMNGAQVVSSSLTATPTDSSHWKVAGVIV